MLDRYRSLVSIRTLIATALFCLAAFILMWWILLVSYPAACHWFWPSHWDFASLRAFMLPDIALLVSLIVMSGVASLKVDLNGRWWVSTTAFVSLYPSLYCFNVSIITDEAWVSTALMFSLTGSLYLCSSVLGKTEEEPLLIRPVELTKTNALVKTGVQVVTFWTTFLVIYPKAILAIERKLELPNVTVMYAEPVSAVLFIAASILGIAAAYQMAAKGSGTPLPSATANKLVVSGPYSIVRNPMAVAGISQGLAVALLLGSLGTAVYCVLGAVLWHLVVRPLEEIDLADRFGDRYQNYRSSVSLWLPRTSVYKAE